MSSVVFALAHCASGSTLLISAMRQALHRVQPVSASPCCNCTAVYHQILMAFTLSRHDILAPGLHYGKMHQLCSRARDTADLRQARTEMFL